MRQIDTVLGVTPAVWRIVISVCLVLFCLVSIYGRINLNFGQKVFSRVKREEIRSNWQHIFRYTVMPVIITGYFMYGAWMGGFQ